MEVPDGEPREAESVSAECGAAGTFSGPAGEPGGSADTTAVSTGRNGAEIAQSQSATGEAPRNGAFYFKRHRATSLLFIVFLIMLISAFFIYPRRAAVYRPQPFGVSIEENGDLSGMKISVSRQGSQFILSINPSYTSTNFPPTLPNFLVFLPEIGRAHV